VRGKKTKLSLARHDYSILRKERAKGCVFWQDTEKVRQPVLFIRSVSSIWSVSSGSAR
jgi:hypothetical protein